MHRADFILDFDDPNDTNTWRVLDKYNAFNQLWDELVFSLRASKGMPANYPKILPKDLALISPWTKFQRGKHRGALHIRVKR